MRYFRKKLEIQELELQIISNIDYFTELMEFKLKFTSYICGVIMVLRLSKLKAHKELIIKYNNELKQNMN